MYLLNTPQLQTVPEEPHRLLRTLTHSIDENSWEEVVRGSGGEVLRVTTWDSSSKLRKIREEVLTRVGGKVTQTDITQYDANGLVKESLTEIFTRVNGRVVSVARTRT